MSLTAKLFHILFPDHRFAGTALGVSADAFARQSDREQEDDLEIKGALTHIWPKETDVFLSGRPRLSFPMKAFCHATTGVMVDDALLTMNAFSSGWASGHAPFASPHGDRILKKQRSLASWDRNGEVPVPLDVHPRTKAMESFITKSLLFLAGYIIFTFISPALANEPNEAASPSVHATMQPAEPQLAPENQLWTQGFEPTTPQDWQKHPSKNLYYTEAWNTVVYADEGHILYLNFLLSNIGLFSGSSALNISLTPAGKKAESYKYTHDFDDLTVRGNVLSLKNSQLILDGKDATLRIRESDFTADLSFKGWIEGFKRHDQHYQHGKYWFNLKDRQYTQLFCHVPRADVTGTLTVKGKTFRMNGAGFIDHYAQNTLYSDYTDQWWHTARLFHQDYTLLATTWRFMKNKGENKLTHLVLLDRSGIRFMTTQARLKINKTVKDPDGYAYPTMFQWSETEEGLEALFTSTRMHERTAILEALPWAIRKLATFVAGNPIFYRMEAQGEVKLAATKSHPAFSFSGRSLIATLYY